MRYLGVAALAAVLTLSLHAAELDMAGCEFPEPPDIPDGTTASEDAMGAASAAVRAYVGDTQAGLDCISEVEQSMGEEITDEQKAEIVTTYNTGVDEMTAVVESFNEQIRAYKAR